MDHKQEQFLRMQQYQYAPRMPFYMSYPVQNIYMTEMEYERDMERMKELYPEEAKQIQKLVEEECDQMEYEGSMMFDEYPDRVMLKVICDRIYQNATKSQGVQSSQIPLQIKSDSGTEAINVKEAISKINMSNTTDTINETDSESTTNTENLENENNIIEEMEGLDLEAENLTQQNFWQGPGRPPGPPGRPPGRPPGPPGPPPGPPPRNPGLNTLIEVLLYNEMYKRRCRHNRCRRWW